MSLIDPIISLVFSIHDSKGVYALLIGSGVSRGAGIPTGWEVILDLIRKIAHIKGEDCEPDPENWYKEKYGLDPDYAKLLKILASSPSERAYLLKNYFEPNEEEQEQGLKIPTNAHRAIAELVANGYIKVIITTNFDRLLEKALDDIGVTPTVISSPDSAEGAFPLTHTTCTIVKLHGDYLDTRIKNTTDELATYDKKINILLDRIFDEFGLIVCGWSAEWDTALRSSLERCKNHRFSTYWTSRGNDNQSALRLIELRKAHRIQIIDADTFFRDLAEKVISLNEFNRPHPLSTKSAIASVKRYLVEDRFQIRLHDLVMEETEKVFEEFTDIKFPVQGVNFSIDELKRRINNYETSLDTLAPLLATGCYWGTHNHQSLWVKVLERIGNNSGNRDGSTSWINLRLYPVLMLLYVSGVASIAAGKYDTLASLINNPVHNDDFERIPLQLKLVPIKIVSKDAMNQVLGKNFLTPTNEHLFEITYSYLKEFSPDDKTYESIFDRFECLFALRYADVLIKQGKSVWGPIGRFGYKLSPYSTNPLKSILSEASEKKDSWEPLKAGLFGGDYVHFEQIATEYYKWASSATQGWW